MVFNIKKYYCKPAYFFLCISLIVLLILTIRNIETNNRLFCGLNKECSGTLAFIRQFIFIICITFILNYICKFGYQTLSWILLIVMCFYELKVVLAAYEINYKLLL